MACGCVDNSCLCVITGGSGVAVSGSGSVANPFVVSAIPGASETSWTGTNTDGGITITPGGTNGHSPVINLNLDPASPAPLSVGVNGLSVECCSGTSELSIIDTDTTLSPGSQAVLVDNSTTPVTVDLPTGSPAGTTVRVKDYGNGGTGNAATNNIFVDPDTETIDGIAGVYTISDDGNAFDFVADGIGGWAVM